MKITQSRNKREGRYAGKGCRRHVRYGDLAAPLMFVVRGWRAWCHESGRRVDKIGRRFETGNFARDPA